MRPSMVKGVLVLAFAFAGFGGEPMQLAGSGSGRREPAGKPSRNVNERQQNQKARVEQGVQSGQLTKVELETIARHEKRVKELEVELRKQGLAPAERKRLQEELDRTSSEIARLKHNDRRQPGAATAAPAKVKRK